MKPFLRFDYDTKEVCKFICVGVWGNGHKAYSKITKDEHNEDVITDFDNGTYYQIRLKGQLVMLHV